MLKREILSRREIITLCPPIETWPTVELSLIESNHQETFVSRCDSVKKYIDGYPIIEIEKITGIRANRISYFVRKCLKTSFDGRIYGFRALIPHLNLKGYERKINNTYKYPEEQGRLAGVFTQILDKYPEIEEKLRQFIKKKNTSKLNVHEKSIRAKDLHNIFLKLLKTVGVRDSEWPFNTKHLGFKTIQKYLNSVLEESFGRTVFTRGEQIAIAHLAVGTGHNKFLVFEEPFDVVQMDAYSINAFFTSEFKTPEGTTVELKLQRIWLIAMIEFVSGAILAYKVVYRSEVSADDVLDVIRSAIYPAPKVTLTIPGLKYPDDGGFPCEVFHECKGVVWGALMLDGALAHLADRVHDNARKQLGFVINWGPVAHFERRADIERYFAKLSKDVFMRLPSTTGSNPHNGRAKNAEENAVKYKIRAEEVEQLIAVITAQHNSTPNQGTSYNSPLEVLKRYVINESNHFILRRLPTKAGASNIIIPNTRICIIRGSLKKGRRPYIQFLGARYTSQILASATGLIGQKLFIEVDSNDCTYCKAYLSNGEELGLLKAQGNWGITVHSIRTRKLILSLITKKLLIVTSHQDPVQIYLDYLSTQKSRVKKNKKTISPSSATEATRVAKESGLPKKIKNENNNAGYVTDKAKDLFERRPAIFNKPMPDLNQFLNKK